MARIELGAPSLTGKEPNDQVKEAFGTASFPQTITLYNLMPRDVSLPDIEVFLRHVSNAAGNHVETEIKDFDSLQRTASDLAQIAELNGYHTAMALEYTEPAKPNPPTEGGGTQGGGTDKGTTDGGSTDGGKTDSGTEPAKPATKAKAARAAK